MDISQLKYFVCIVDSDFNLSSASRKLHISQPALTQYIRKFEDEENTELFIRSSGRLVGLTVSGENFYVNAMNVVKHHELMLKELRENASTIKGKIAIGVPPLILTVLFTRLLSQLITKNPFINFVIVEEGAFELEKQMVLHEIDFAIILQPTDLKQQLFSEDLIHKDELTAFMSIDHPLAQQDTISWFDLKQHPLAIFKETFMIRHQLERKFESLGFRPNIAITSSSWDFLLESTRGSNFITILPSPTRNHMRMEGIVEKHFDQPISWHVVLAYPIKQHHNRIEIYVKRSIIDFFTKGIDIEPIK
ncbi:MAG: LysR family transcriptional [Erysipelotrichaceae bacterium]|nr:MAG: LysR family transcriptional [Erysipelotrichaceae bacterium]